jgi:DNA-binding transcriptional LysR family regulator
MVAAGVGVAIVPSSVASAADERIVLRRLVRPARPGALLVVRRRVDRDPAVADFCALMGSAFAELRRLVERRWREG